MTMAITTYRSRNAQEHTIIDFLTTGFTGQLRNWWDNSINMETKVQIFNIKNPPVW